MERGAVLLRATAAESSHHSAEPESTEGVSEQQSNEVIRVQTLIIIVIGNVIYDVRPIIH